MHGPAQLMPAQRYIEPGLPRALRLGPFVESAPVGAALVSDKAVDAVRNATPSRMLGSWMSVAVHTIGYQRVFKSLLMYKDLRRN